MKKKMSQRMSLERMKRRLQRWPAKAGLPKSPMAGTSMGYLRALAALPGVRDMLPIIEGKSAGSPANNDRLRAHFASQQHQRNNVKSWISHYDGYGAILLLRRRTKSF